MRACFCVSVCDCLCMYVCVCACAWVCVSAAGSDLFVYGLCNSGDLQSRGISTGGLCWSEIMVLI